MPRQRKPETEIAERGLIVDLFAGGGGTSLGIEWALGRSPDIAINHDREALAMHMANHPSTVHYHEDVRKVDIRKVVAGRPVALLWLSPDCKHHSKAKGGKPVDRKIRGLAWEAVRWAEQVRPSVICLENVQEFADWGPLDKNHKPDRLRGTSRFVIRNPKPFIVRYNNDDSFRGQETHAPISTLDGSNRFGLVAPLLIPRYGERVGQDPRCRSVEDPAPVIVPTQNGGQLVAAFLAKHNGGHEATGTQLSLPADTITARDHHSLVTAHIQRDFGRSVGSAVDAPVGTITPGGGGKAALVRAFLIKYHDNGGQWNDLFSPAPTVVANDSIGLVMVNGAPHVIVDIGLRMLVARELFRCQGFPDSYKIDIECERMVRGKLVRGRLPADAQVRMCGNSVPPQLSAALVAANAPALAQEGVA